MCVCEQNNAAEANQIKIVKYLKKISVNLEFPAKISFKNED